MLKFKVFDEDDYEAGLFEKAVNTFLKKHGDRLRHAQVGKTFAAFLYDDGGLPEEQPVVIRRIRNGSGETRQPRGRVSAGEPSSQGSEGFRFVYGDNGLVGFTDANGITHWSGR